MFESVLNCDRISSGGVKTGALLATVVHAGLVAGAVFLSGRAIVSSRPPEAIPPVIVWKNPGNSSGAGQAQSRASKEASSQSERHRRAARTVQTGPVIAKRASPVEARADISTPISDPSLDQSSAPLAATGAREAESSEAGNCRRGDCGASPLGPDEPGERNDLGIRVMGPGMSPPRLVDPGEQIQYTRQASEARVKGVMQVQCILTIEGRVTNCTAIAPVPFMEAAVLKSLMSRRYTPVRFEGRPVPVKYNFAITLKAAE